MSQNKSKKGFFKKLYEPVANVLDFMKICVIVTYYPHIQAIFGTAAIASPILDAAANIGAAGLAANGIFWAGYGAAGAPVAVGVAAVGGAVYAASFLHGWYKRRHQ
jgi:hypothetical protein